MNGISPARIIWWTRCELTPSATPTSVAVKISFGTMNLTNFLLDSAA
jgi:hypothetical protein